MKGRKKSFGCSIDSIIGGILAIVLMPLFANSDENGFPLYLIPTLLVIGIPLFIIMHAKRGNNDDEIRRVMGDQYTRNDKRLELCQKLIPDDAQFNTFDALDFPVVLFNEGSSAVWAYDAETEKIMLHWLVLEKDVDKLGNRFYALHKEISAKGIKCEKEVIIQEREKGCLTDKKYAGGLVGMKFKMVFSKDTGWDDVKCVLQQMFTFADKNAATIVRIEDRV